MPGTEAVMETNRADRGSPSQPRGAAGPVRASREFDAGRPALGRPGAGGGGAVVAAAEAPAGPAPRARRVRPRAPGRRAGPARADHPGRLDRRSRGGRGGPRGLPPGRLAFPERLHRGPSVVGAAPRRAGHPDPRGGAEPAAAGDRAPGRAGGGWRAPRAVMIVIAGRTYIVQRIAGTELAPVQWRLTRPASTAGGRPLLRLPPRRRLNPVRLRRVDVPGRRPERHSPRPLQAPRRPGGPGLDLTGPRALWENPWSARRPAR